MSPGSTIDLLLGLGVLAWWYSRRLSAANATYSIPLNEFAKPQSVEFVASPVVWEGDHEQAREVVRPRTDSIDVETSNVATIQLFPVVEVRVALEPLKASKPRKPLQARSPMPAKPVSASMLPQYSQASLNVHTQLSPWSTGKRV